MTTIQVIAVAGSGLMAGLFFVFSFSVMDALAQMPTSEGMKAMQLINRTILNPVRVTSVADQERDFQSRANKSRQCRTFHG